MKTDLESKASCFVSKITQLFQNMSGPESYIPLYLEDSDFFFESEQLPWHKLSSDFYVKNISSAVFSSDDYFKYYLPGFMISALTRNNECGLLIDEILLSRCCFEDGNKIVLKIDLKGFSHEQIELVTDVMIFFRNEDL